MATLGQSIADLFTLDLTIPGTGGLLDLLQAAEKQSRALHGFTIAIIGQIDERGLAAPTGQTSTATLIGQVINIAPSDATARVALATQTCPTISITGITTDPALPQLAAAIHTGNVSARHAQAIITTFRKMPAHVTTETRESVEKFLVEQATELDPLSFEHTARHIELLANPDGDPDDKDAHEKQELHIGNRRPNGLTKIWGLLDDITTEQLRIAFGALCSPSAERNRDKKQEREQEQQEKGRRDEKDSRRPTPLLDDETNPDLGDPEPTTNLGDDNNLQHTEPDMSADSDRKRLTIPRETDSQTTPMRSTPATTEARTPVRCHGRPARNGRTTAATGNPHRRRRIPRTKHARPPERPGPVTGRATRPPAHDLTPIVIPGALSTIGRATTTVPISTPTRANHGQRRRPVQSALIARATTNPTTHRTRHRPGQSTTDEDIGRSNTPDTRLSHHHMILDRRPHPSDEQSRSTTATRRSPTPHSTQQHRHTPRQQTAHRRRSAPHATAPQHHATSSNELPIWRPTRPPLDWAPLGTCARDYTAANPATPTTPT